MALLIECAIYNAGEIILNMDQWFQKCCLKMFLSRALAAILFGEVEPFVQFYSRAS